MAFPSKPCPPRIDLTKLAADAAARVRAMSPEQQAAMWRAQRESWVVGEMMLEHPEMTREQAKALYDKVVI